MRASARSVVLLGIALALPWTAAGAQLGRLLPAKAADRATVAPPVAPDSPQAMLETFLRDARQGHWDAAARALALTNDAQRARGAELAQRLKAVLDRRLPLDIESFSPVAAGDTADGLDGRRERVGEFAGPDGQPARVRLERIRDGGETRWVFSAATVAAIDEWYAALDDAWLRERLPAPLLRPGPLDAPWWQWLAIALLLPVLALLAWTVGWVLRRGLGAIARRTPGSLDDELLVALAGPFRLWIAALASGPALSVLGLNAGFRDVIASGARGVAWAAFFWAGLRGITLLQRRFEDTPWGNAQAHTRALVPLVGRVLRVTFVILAVLAALAEFGYPVGTLLAGLGIGGIALALAAQKTVEHLFGSLSLAADRTFGVGDFVRVDGIEGSVEAIGLRSTKIRTPDRTLVKFPNGRLADLKIESFGERDRIRMLTPFGIEYGTTAEVLRQILGEIEAMLRAHPKIWPEQVVVDFTGFGESSLDCRVLCWFETADVFEFNAIRTAVLVDIMRIVEQRGGSFAFPTRTVRVTTSGPVPEATVLAAAPAGAD
ncbi:MAG: mechanosensitive ion channel family protein [Gemmatimonadaceae bacterium]|nr:mechanosensitive ion channel family protein [Gemmatimonadaceae bacterium]